MVPTAELTTNTRRPRVHQAYALVREMVVQLGPDARLPRYAELLDSTGVSKGTLNTALKRLEAEGLVRRVQGGGIYTPSLQGSGIAVLVDPSLTRMAQHSPFWDMLLAQLVEAGRSGENDYGLYFTRPGRFGEDALLPVLKQEITAGRIQILICIGINKLTWAWLRESGVRVVSFAGPGHHQVNSDSDIVFGQALQYLVAQGCESMALWGLWCPCSPRETNRYFLEETVHAYLEAGLSLGISPGKCQYQAFYPLEFTRPVAGMPGWIEGTESHEEQGYRHVREFYGSGQTGPQGLIIRDDLMTRGALVAFDELGIEVGRTVHIVSHSNRNSNVLKGQEHRLALYEVDPLDLVNGLLETARQLATCEETPAKFIAFAPRVHFRAVSEARNTNHRVQRETRL